MILLLFWISIALAILLWIALTYVLSGITELVSGMRNDKEALVTHGVKRIIIWLLIGITALYAGGLLVVHILFATINQSLPKLPL